MPGMSNLKRVIGMTGMSSNTISVSDNKADEYKRFCLDNCPHEDKPCNGNCKEIQEWIKNNKRS